MLAIMLTALGGVVALSFDLGRMWNLSTELQTAVDAGALAGATQLNGDDGSRLLAAQAAASEMARNQQIYASVDGAGDVTYSTVFDCTDPVGCEMKNDNFQFFVAIDPDIPATSDADAKFIEVTASRTVGFSFAALVGADNQASPIASAVAGWERFICGNMSLMMCNPAEPDGNTDLGFPFVLEGTATTRDYRGAGITLKEKGGGGHLIPGEFAWLQPVVCTIAADGTETCVPEPGANSLCEALAQVDPPESCVGNTVVLQTGTITAVGRCINMRLDIYPSNGPINFAADPDYRPSPNPLTGVARDPSGNPGQCDFNPVGAGGGALKKMVNIPMPEYKGELKTNGGVLPMHVPTFNAGTGTYDFDPVIDHMGYPRDRCAYVDENDVPIADTMEVDEEFFYSDHCIFAPPASSGITAGEQVGSGWWDFDTYWDYHHPGETRPMDPFTCVLEADGCTLGSGATAVDVDTQPYGDGNGRISRWEVYNYEIDTTLLPNFQYSMCYENPPPAPVAPNRRVLGVAVANCNAIIAAGAGIGKNKNKPLPLAGTNPAVNVFLSEAIGELSDNAWYGELIDPAGADGDSTLTSVNKRERIVLHR